MKAQFVYVPYNTKGRYFAMGGVSHSAERARNFMASDKDEWRRDRRKGWKILKCKLVPPKSR
jgi:hypothetical protein